jgi:hypothetical protein
MADDAQGAAGQRPAVSLAEAARLTGRHPEALRALARRGRLVTRRGNDGRLLVELPADLMPEQRPAKSGQEPAAAGQRPAEWPDLAGQVADLETLVGELRDELMAAKLTIGRLEAERDAAKSLTAAEVAAVRAEVTAKDMLIEELRTLLTGLRGELAEARKPWWRRLFG